MTSGKPTDPDGRIATLIAEIERWNLQINLVSRVRTRRRVEALVTQCEAGWQLASEALADADWFGAAAYCDLGSGAGLPGLVWAVARARASHTGISVLVEPRDKRAWFLRRTARLMDLESVSVLDERWGDGEIGGAEGGVLVSLKALRLDDVEILSGLARYRGSSALPREVAILRFLDPERHTQTWLEDRFAAPHGEEPELWRRTGIESLGDGDPRLLLTRYRSA